MLRLEQRLASVRLETACDESAQRRQFGFGCSNLRVAFGSLSHDQFHATAPVTWIGILRVVLSQVRIRNAEHVVKHVFGVNVETLALFHHGLLNRTITSDTSFFSITRVSNVHLLKSLPADVGWLRSVDFISSFKASKNPASMLLCAFLDVLLKPLEKGTFVLQCFFGKLQDVFLSFEILLGFENRMLNPLACN